MAVDKTVVRLQELRWRPHEYGGQNRVRVWRTVWEGGERFELLSRKDFEKLQELCKRFDISLTEAEDEDD